LSALGAGIAARVEGVEFPWSGRFCPTLIAPSEMIADFRSEDRVRPQSNVQILTSRSAHGPRADLAPCPSFPGCLQAIGDPRDVPGLVRPQKPLRADAGGRGVRESCAAPPCSRDEPPPATLRDAVGPGGVVVRRPMIRGGEQFGRLWRWCTAHAQCPWRRRYCDGTFGDHQGPNSSGRRSARQDARSRTGVGLWLQICQQ